MITNSDLSVEKPVLENTLWVRNGRRVPSKLINMMMMVILVYMIMLMMMIMRKVMMLILL